MSEGLTFAALREANRRRMPQFRDAHGRRCHAVADGSDWSAAQWLQAVIGEIGEYANVRKKFERGDLTEAEFRALAGAELADVECYLAILWDRLGLDPEAEIIRKFNAVSERVGSDVRLGDRDTPSGGGEGAGSATPGQAAAPPCSTAGAGEISPAPGSVVPGGAGQEPAWVDLAADVGEVGLCDRCLPERYLGVDGWPTTTIHTQLQRVRTAVGFGLAPASLSVLLVDVTAGLAAAMVRPLAGGVTSTNPIGLSWALEVAAEATATVMDAAGPSDRRLHELAPILSLEAALEQIEALPEQFKHRGLNTRAQRVEALTVRLAALVIAACRRVTGEDRADPYVHVDRREYWR